MADEDGCPRGVRLPAVWNYGAVERAIRQAADRPGQHIFKPELHAVLGSTQEGYELYNMYSWECGFGIRFGRSRDNKDGKRTKQDIVCACQGVDATPGARTIRTGCQAMIRLLLADDDSWYISRFVDEHNHPLSESVGERRQWNSHNIDETTRELVRNLRSNNVQISRVCSIVGTMQEKRNPSRLQISTSSDRPHYISKKSSAYCY